MLTGPETECLCGQPLFDYMIVCHECGEDNLVYKSMTWGRELSAGMLACLVGVIVYALLDEASETDDRFFMMFTAGAFAAIMGLFKVWDLLRAHWLRARIRSDR